MFDGLRLRNFRSLKDTGMVALKPITLLLGQNSSGKSTFLRTLPLIRQSIGTRSSSPVLWYGDFVDFGSYSEVRSTFAGDDTVGLSFRFDTVSLQNVFYFPIYRDRPPLSNVTLSIELGEIDGSTKLRSFRVSIGEDVLDVHLDQKGQTLSIAVNGEDFTKVFPKERLSFSLNEVVPQAIIQQDRVTRTAYLSSGRPNGITDLEIFGFLTGLFDNRVSENTIRGLVRRFEYTSKDEFKNRVENINVDLKSWSRAKTIILHSSGTYGMERLRSLYLLGIVPDILHSINQSLANSVRQLSYVGPSRATGERYYRHQELAVDQIDPQGQNLAMYLYSLTPTQRESFSSWLEAEIGYSLRVDRQGGHIQIELRERGAQHFHNLADMGYGFSQVLPVMAQIWGKSQRRASPSVLASPYIAIEQPELHLHPAYQARLADVMASSIKTTERARRKARFVVETHSEALVNRLGELVYDGKLSANDVAIYLFHRVPETDATEITKSTFREDGSLTDWPLGFFSSKARV